jgi:hypothetical protein
MRRWWNGLNQEQRGLVTSVGTAWALWALYVVSPIDLLPDLIPVLGLLDDLAAFVAVVAFTAFVAVRLRGSGFAGLMPEALRPRSLQSERALEAEPATEIPGYHPLSVEEIRSL